MVQQLGTFRSLTAPGYFNFSGTQLPLTGKISDWIDLLLERWTEQAILYDNFFRLWATYTYSGLTLPRAPYVDYLMYQYGISWFQGNNAQSIGILDLVSRGYSTSTSRNITFTFDALALPPFEWCIAPVQIVYGSQKPAISAETLIIFSDSVSLPATPSPTPYSPRNWEAPVDWTLYPSESTYYSRGYLDSGDIVWMDPQSTADPKPFYNVELLADLPPAPDTGSLGGVEDDGTGDVGSIYYFDGSDWQKTSTPNANQGQVIGGVFDDPSPRSVAAPNPDTSTQPITSETSPPADGPSQGYGIYGGLAQQDIQARAINMIITLTDAGVANLGMIINLLRRIKPTLNQFILFYNTVSNPGTSFQVEILDSGAIGE